MKIIKSKIKVIILFLIILGNFISGNTYYVDKEHQSASDSNPGTISLPWLTIQHAAENVAAGDTVYIKSGIYNEHIYMEYSGEPSNYIIFSAFPGETPVVDGTGVTDSQNGIIMVCSYVKLQGLEIRNWNDNGIWVENSSYFEINDCELHSIAYGIGITEGSHDFVINNVLVHDFDLYGIDVSPGDNPCYNGTFNDCISHTGRDPDQNVDGYALGHGVQHTFVFNRCITYGVYDGFDISSRNSTLNECLAYNCSNGAYKLWQDDVNLYNCIGYNCQSSIVEIDWDGEPGLTTLMNCTFFNSEVFTVWIENSADTVHMYNCIVSGGNNIGLAFETMGTDNYSGDYNLFQNDNASRIIAVAYEDEFTLNQVKSGAWTNYSGQDANSIVVSTTDSIFIDPANINLHLVEYSPAIDKGTSVGAPSIDFDGISRPYGSSIDIGAYEFSGIDDVEQSENVNKDFEIFQLYQNYPNPFNPATKIKYSIPGKDKIKNSKLENVVLKIYDILGREVTTLVNEEQKQGNYEVIWDASNHPSGVYLYKLRSGESIETKKMLLIK